jgi:hypothetical protein
MNQQWCKNVLSLSELPADIVRAMKPDMVQTKADSL